MAKIYGLFGSMTGKLADVVMSVRNGEQIARKYQPVVFNPSTPAQIATRAKLKLASQLSAVMSPYIAIRSQGPVSSRNLFVKENYRLLSYSENTASVQLEDLQLTKSVVSLPAISATNAGGDFSVQLATAATELSRVVYVAFVRTDDDKLRYNGSVAVTNPGTGGRFAGTLSALQDADSIVYAYGMRDNTEAARMAFGNMKVPTSVETATLIVTRNLTETDVTLTETRSATVTSSKSNRTETDVTLPEDKSATVNASKKNRAS